MRNISTETFECENCGGLLKFSITKQKFACESCGAEKDIGAAGSKVTKNDLYHYLERERSSVAFTGMASVSCQRCGMEISFDESQIAATCPMCDSSQVATVKQSAGIPPDGIVPFKIDKRDAQQKFKAWVKSRWFAPNDFKKRYGEGDLKGMYLPFWTYDAHAVSNYSGRGGKNRKVKDNDGKERTVIDWTPVSGVVSSTFDEIQICASSKQDNIKGVLPYDTAHNTKPFSAGYFAGYYAEVYKIKANTAFEDAKKFMEEKMKTLAENDIRRNYDVADVQSIKTTYSNVTYRHLLMPLWESAFGYSGKVYQYLVNGETGKVSGSRPYSIAKISAAVIAGIIALIILLSVKSCTESESEYIENPAIIQQLYEIHDDACDYPLLIDEEGEI